MLSHSWIMFSPAAEDLLCFGSQIRVAEYHCKALSTTLSRRYGVHHAAVTHHMNSYNFGHAVKVAPKYYYHQYYDGIVEPYSDYTGLPSIQSLAQNLRSMSAQQQTGSTPWRSGDCWMWTAP